MKFIVVDSSLKDRIGHHYEYTRSLVSELRARGWKTAVYANRGIEPSIMEEVAATPAFRRTIYDGLLPRPLSSQGIDLLKNVSYFTELLDITEVNEEFDGIVLFHTTNLNQLFGIYTWGSLRLRNGRSKLVILLRFKLPESGPGRAAYTVSLRLLKRLGDRIVFLSDSRSLADDYARLAGIEVHVMPIPHVPDPGTWQIARRKTVQLFCPGIAREEKGFHLLPAVVEHFSHRSPDLRFVMQSILHRPTAAVLTALRRIRSSATNVILLDRPLTTEEYHDRMRDADAVLIPYNADNYGGRTSGVFAEAMAFGKPVITTRCGWLEENIERYDFGVLIEHYSPAGIVEAVGRYLERKSEFERKAGEVSADWRRHHNPGAYVDRLIDLCGIKRNMPPGRPAGAEGR